MRRWHRNEFAVVLSDYLLDELTEVFGDPYFSKRLAKRVRSQALWSFRNAGERVNITDHVLGLATHPEDDPVLATAISANVDYLVTGDNALRQLGAIRDVAILTPREFLTVLGDVPSLPEE